MFWAAISFLLMIDDSVVCVWCVGEVRGGSARQGSL